MKRRVHMRLYVSRDMLRNDKKVIRKVVYTTIMNISKQTCQVNKYVGQFDTNIINDIFRSRKIHDA